MDDYIRMWKPPRINVPQDIGTRHWADEANKTRAELEKWLCVPKSHRLMLLDRGTHAIEIGLKMLQRKLALVLHRTYRAAKDAAIMAGYNIRYLPLDGWCSGIEDPGRDCVYIPTTLGGTKIRMGRLNDWKAGVLIDSAHTCYPRMFSGVELGENVLVALSFFQTKPLGALGGGALIAPQRMHRLWTKTAWPLDREVNCQFYYPFPVQSWAIRDRIHHWDWHRVSQHRLICRKLRTFVWENFGLNSVHIEAVTPHVLVFRGQDEYLEMLRTACDDCGIEHGEHYPQLDNPYSKSNHVSIPFHTMGVLHRLRDWVKKE